MPVPSQPHCQEHHPAHNQQQQDAQHYILLLGLPLVLVGLVQLPRGQRHILIRVEKIIANYVQLVPLLVHQLRCLAHYVLYVDHPLVRVVQLLRSLLDELALYFVIVVIQVHGHLVLVGLRGLVVVVRYGCYLAALVDVPRLHLYGWVGHRQRGSL